MFYLELYIIKYHKKRNFFIPQLYLKKENYYTIEKYEQLRLEY